MTNLVNCSSTDINNYFEVILDRYFYVDGSLRDLYLVDCDLNSIQKFLNYIETNYSFNFSVDSTPADLLSFENIRSLRSSVPISFSFMISEVSINVHFWSDELIEFDVCPKEVNRSTQVEALVSFIEEASLFIGSPIYLCDEMEDNFRDKYYLKFSPADKSFTLNLKC